MPKQRIGGGSGGGSPSQVSVPQVGGATVSVPFELVVSGMEVEAIPEQPRITLRRTYWRDFLLMGR